MAACGREAFVFGDDTITVKIPYHKLDYRDTPAPEPRMVSDISPVESELMRYIRSNPRITQKQAAEAMGLSKTTITNAMNRMQSNRLIRRNGSRKSGYWVLVDE